MPQIHPSPWGFTCRGVATPAVVCSLCHSHNTHAPVDGHPVGLTMGCGQGLHLRGQTRDRPVRTCKHAPGCSGREFGCPGHPEHGGGSQFSLAFGILDFKGEVQSSGPPSPGLRAALCLLALEIPYAFTLAAAQPTLPNVMGLEWGLCVCLLEALLRKREGALCTPGSV